VIDSSAYRIPDASPASFLKLAASLSVVLLACSLSWDAWPIAGTLLAVTLAGLTALTRDPDVCQRARPPFNIESSGAVIMRPATGDFWAVSGSPADHEYEHLRLSAP